MPTIKNRKHYGYGIFKKLWKFKNFSFKSTVTFKITIPNCAASCYPARTSFYGTYGKIKRFAPIWLYPQIVIKQHRNDEARCFTASLELFSATKRHNTRWKENFNPKKKTISGKKGPLWSKVSRPILNRFEPQGHFELTIFALFFINFEPDSPSQDGYQKKPLFKNGNKFIALFATMMHALKFHSSIWIRYVDFGDVTKFILINTEHDQII